MQSLTILLKPPYDNAIEKFLDFIITPVLFPFLLLTFIII